MTGKRRQERCKKKKLMQEYSMVVLNQTNHAGHTFARKCNDIDSINIDLFNRVLLP